MLNLFVKISKSWSCYLILFVIRILYYCIHGKVCLGYSEYNQSLLLLMQSVCSSAVIQVFLDNLTFFKVTQQQPGPVLAWSPPCLLSDSERRWTLDILKSGRYTVARLQAGLHCTASVVTRDPLQGLVSTPPPALHPSPSPCLQSGQFLCCVAWR